MSSPADARPNGNANGMQWVQTFRVHCTTDDDWSRSAPFSERQNAGQIVETLNDHLSQCEAPIAPHAESRVRLTANTDLMDTHTLWCRNTGGWGKRHGARSNRATLLNTSWLTRIWTWCLLVRSVHCSTGTVEATCFPVSHRLYISPANGMRANRRDRSGDDRGWGSCEGSGHVSRYLSFYECAICF